MHPIERLRFVARSQGAPAELLVEEAAIALGAFRDDPAGMVAACRRIIDRQLACGPLWWLCARILCGTDPMAEARAAVTDMEADPTARCLAAALPDDATVVVVGVPEVTLAALARRGDVRPLIVDVAATLGDAAASVLVESPSAELSVDHQLAAEGYGDRAACIGSTSDTWSFPTLTTTRDAGARLTLFNPFPGDAGDIAERLSKPARDTGL